MRKRAGIAVALAAMALAAPGCGGGESSPSDVAEGALEALAEGDAQKVCESLTTAARDLVEQSAGVLGAPPGSSCEQVAERAAQLAAPYRGRLEDTRVLNETVQGGSATLTVFGLNVPIVMEKESGAWRISAQTVSRGIRSNVGPGAGSGAAPTAPRPAAGRSWSRPSRRSAS